MAVVINKKLNELGSPVAVFREDNFVIFSSSTTGALSGKIKITNTTNSEEKEFRVSIDPSGKVNFNVTEALKSFFTLPNDTYNYQAGRDEIGNNYIIFDITYTIVKASIEESAVEEGVVAIRAKSTFKQSKYINSIYLMPKANRIAFSGYPQSVTKIENGRLIRYLLGNGTTQFNQSEVHSTIDREGIYVKWLNQEGGYSYWVFSNVFVHSDSIEKSDEVKSNIVDDYFIQKNDSSYTNKLGNSTRIEVRTDAKDLDEILMMKSLSVSEEIYVYTGGKDSGEVSNRYWIKVKNEQSSLTYSSKKNLDKTLITLRANDIAPDLIPYLLNCREKIEAPSNLAAEKVGEEVNLTWDDTNTDRIYEVEKSFDQISWVKIAETTEKELTVQAD